MFPLSLALAALAQNEFNLNSDNHWDGMDTQVFCLDDRDGDGVAGLSHCQVAVIGGLPIVAFQPHQTDYSFGNSIAFIQPPWAPSGHDLRSIDS